MCPLKECIFEEFHLRCWYWRRLIYIEVYVFVKSIFKCQYQMLVIEITIYIFSQTSVYGTNSTKQYKITYHRFLPMFRLFFVIDSIWQLWTICGHFGMIISALLNRFWFIANVSDEQQFVLERIYSMQNLPCHNGSVTVIWLFIDFGLCTMLIVAQHNEVCVLIFNKLIHICCTHWFLAVRSFTFRDNSSKLLLAERFL